MVTPPPTVDISRLDTCLVVQVASFVGTSRELRNLALTCKAFGRKQPGSGLDLSLAEEVARGAVRSWRYDVDGARIATPPPAGRDATWLSVLREAERPLRFDSLLGGGVVYARDGRTSVRGTRTGDDGETLNTGTAVARNYVMESGVHYAEFRIGEGKPYIGVVRPTPNLDPGRFADFFARRFFGEFLAARTEEWGNGDVHACEFFCKSGNRNSTNWDGMTEYFEYWRGAEGCHGGDRIGMLLNLDDGTLTVYKNKRRLGVMKDGLSGSYCWYATLTKGDAVTIRMGEAPKA